MKIREIKPIRLKNIKRLLRLPVGKEAVYDVETEVISWAVLHADFYVERYMQTPSGKHWSQREVRNIRIGLLGQKIFDIILQQLAVPKDHNDPVIDWRREKPYDFNIPGLGTVEVKTFDHYCTKVLVKVKEWHGNDYLVVFQLVGKTFSTVHMKGWLTREQVESLRVSRKGEHFTPYADAYITEFDKLKPANQFISMLYRLSLKGVKKRMAEDA